MKTLTELCIIMAFGFMGEVAAWLLPVTVPSSILGLVFLLVAMRVGLVKVAAIESTADFLLANMAFFFLPAIINILECYSILAPVLGKLFLICVVSTVASFCAAYAVAALARRKAKEVN